MNGPNGSPEDLDWLRRYYEDEVTSILAKERDAFRMLGDRVRKEVVIPFCNATKTGYGSLSDCPYFFDASKKYYKVPGHFPREHWDLAERVFRILRLPISGGCALCRVVPSYALPAEVLSEE